MKHVHAVQTLLMSNINFNKHVHFVWPCNCNTIILRPHTCHSCDTNPELGSLDRSKFCSWFCSWFCYSVPLSFAGVTIGRERHSMKLNEHSLIDVHTYIVYPPFTIVEPGFELESWRGGGLGQTVRVPPSIPGPRLTWLPQFLRATIPHTCPRLHIHTSSSSNRYPKLWIEWWNFSFDSIKLRNYSSSPAIISLSSSRLSREPILTKVWWLKLERANGRLWHKDDWSISVFTRWRC